MDLILHNTLKVMCGMSRLRDSRTAILLRDVELHAGSSGGSGGGAGRLQKLQFSHVWAHIGLRRSSDCIKFAPGATAAARPPILTPRRSSATPMISFLHVNCGAELLPVAVQGGADAMHALWLQPCLPVATGGKGGIH